VCLIIVQTKIYLYYVVITVIQIFNKLLFNGTQLLYFENEISSDFTIRKLFLKYIDLFSIVLFSCVTALLILDTENYQLS